MTEREAIRRMLEQRYHGAVEITEAMIDAVLAGLREERRNGRFPPR